MAITNYLVHFTTEATYNNKKLELRNDAVAFVKDATIIHTHGTDYYCGSGPVALKSDLSGYATTSALTSGLAGKANTSHTHTISQVSGLQDELDSKLESADLSEYALKTDIPSLSGGASATSGQYVSGVTVSGHEVTVTKAALPVTTLSSLGITATAAELNYCDGVTSNIQTQLNGKAASSHTHTASQVSGLATVATSGSYDDLTDKPSIPTAITVDSALSPTSTNPVQNKVINSALAGKAASTHTHSASDITSGTLAIARIPTGTTSSTVALGNHTHSGYATTSQLNNYLPLSGGSMTGGIDLSNATSSVGSAPNCVLALNGKKIDLGGGYTIGDYGGTFKYGDHVVLTEANYSDYISSTDTKNTTGTSNSTSKLYLAGGTTQSSTGVVTYSNSSVYTQSGQLYATRMNAINGFYETSDARLKNFKDDIKALDVVSEIPTKYFTWKEDKNQESQIGTSAQEVQKIYPELVSKTEDNTLTVDYAKLSIIALAAIKELKVKIQSLKEEIKQLKSK